MTILAISKLYTANLDNRIVLFSTNLKDFAEALAKLEPNTKPYHTMRRDFDKQKEIEFIGKSGKVYLLQEVYNAKRSANLL